MLNQNIHSGNTHFQPSFQLKMGITGIKIHVLVLLHSYMILNTLYDLVMPTFNHFFLLRMSIKGMFLF